MINATGWGKFVHQLFDYIVSVMDKTVNQYILRKVALSHNIAVDYGLSYQFLGIISVIFLSEDSFKYQDN